MSHATPDALDVPLIGIHQIGFDNANTEEEIQVRTRHMIARSLNTRSIIAFVGSGISKGYGHRDWDSYAAELVGFTIREIGHAIRIEHKEALETYCREKERNDRNSSLTRSDQTLVILDLCDELFAKQGPDLHEKFRAHTASVIEKERPLATDGLDPLGSIIEKLEIRRFLTTNYDLQIEDALKRVLNCQFRANHEAYKHASDDGAVKLVAQSLIHSPNSVEDLTQFAVGAPGYEWGVFHLHGVVGDRPSMVVTERDYQRVYLQEDRSHRAFREALQIAFVGNAILFMGIGMEESDLLRPLRQFVTEEARGGHERPLFALLPDLFPNQTAKAEFRHYLYSRYGVKTLYYPVEEGDAGHTKSFCAAIEHLGDSWSRWWKGWQKKPVVRKPEFYKLGDGRAMIRHFTTGKPLFPVESDREKVGEKIANGPGAVLVLGWPGSGKGTLGQTIAANNTASPYTKRFFATAHFSNDFLCMIDAAADFFAGGASASRVNPVMPPLKRFEAVLNSSRNLFVIGGLERILVPSSLERTIKVEEAMKFEYPIAVGKPLTHEVTEFFALVKRQIEGRRTDPERFLSRIVLTSSIWPETLEDSGIETVWLSGVAEATIVDDPYYRELDHGLVTLLHQTLRGHAYALAVVRSALAALEQHKQASVEQRERWLDRVVDRLSAVDLDGRAAMAIGIASRVLLEAAPATLPALDGILQRVALFTTPVTPAAVHACYRQALKHPVEAVEQALRYLQDSNLLIRVDYEHRPSFRTTAHTLVRNYVLKRMGYFPSAPGEAHSFEIAGWSSEVPDTLSGRGHGHKLSVDSIDAILDSLEAGRGEMEHHAYRDLIRAAFGLIRSRWTATAIPRLNVLEPEATLRFPRPHYDAYQRRLARLLNAIRTMTRMPLWINEKGSRTTVEDRTGVLYADELAWLYNEMGLVAFCSGLVSDSYALFRAGEHVNAVAERGFHGHRWCASEINLGLVQIERGHLVRGRYHLDSAVRTAETLRDPDLKARARGHLGLVHHLMGNYARAERLYQDAIDVLLPAGNHRGASIFLWHRCDLLRRMEKFKEAWNDLRDCVAAAESGRHPDLVHYATLVRAKLRRANGEFVALEELTPAIEFARRVGIPRLECDVQMVQGQIALEQGEYDMAGQLAVSSLGIASSFGLRLRLTGSLILLGRVSNARGQWNAAAQLYRAAVELAERQRNQLLIEKGEEALRVSRSLGRRQIRVERPQNETPVRDPEQW